MAKESGFVLIVNDDAYAEVIEERISDWGRFTHVLTSADHNASTYEIGLLSLDGSTFDRAGIVEVGQTVATGQVRVAMSDMIEFAPVTFDQLREATSENLDLLFAPGARTLADASWQAGWGAVKGLRPGDAGLFEGLERDLAARSTTTLLEDERGVLAGERDSLALALRIFGLTAAEQGAILRSSVPPPGPRSSYLLGVGQPNFSEDVMVQHDASLVPGWISDLTGFVGAVNFERSNDRLTVVNVNRQGVEHTLGADLLYVHHKFESFVFVQYKKMTEGPIFRPGGASYLAELARMQAVDAGMTLPAPTSASEYRLLPRAFFFKICPKLNINQARDQLVKGMYFPLDHWPLVLNDPKVVGQRGGVGITYENVERYMDNTLFIDLVSNGWVGSRGADSVVLSRLVNEALGLQHSVTIAVSSLIP